jgi:radical SAM superfamily enzyme YgiQ (UPF0313 family)
MKKVLLVNPPLENIIRSHVPDELEGETGCLPPLGLLYLATILEKGAFCEVEILDAAARKLGHLELRDEVLRRQPDLVGIPATTFTLIDAVKSAQLIKEADKEILICFGGPHLSIYPEETLNLPYVDFIVSGEGEFVLLELVKNLDSHSYFKNIKSLGYKSQGVSCINENLDFIQDLDSLPFPDRSLLPQDDYYSLLSTNRNITAMITSRGCPFNCLYCYRYGGSLFRARSAQNVVAEMAECKKSGLQEIFIIDDTFTVDKKRVLAICEEIKNLGLNILWDIRARVDTVDVDMLKQLKQAGCDRIHFGIESGDEEILKTIKKGISLKKAKEVFCACRDIGISTLAYFIIGLPGEKIEQVNKTIDFALKLNPDFAQFSIATPFPESEFYSLAFKRNIFKEDYWEEFARFPKQGFRPRLWNENFTELELLQLVKKAHRKFYVRPQYILKSLGRIKNITEFKRKTRVGLKILSSSLRFAKQTEFK